MAFMVIVTILVIAICRVHMKRTLMAGATISPGAHLSGTRSGAGRMPQQMYDVDLFFGHTRPGLLVTYNINNGVQFVGRPVDPPPYSEVVSTPPREGPPPPYVSHENLSRYIFSVIEVVIFNARTVFHISCELSFCANLVLLLFLQDSCN